MTEHTLFLYEPQISWEIKETVLKFPENTAVYYLVGNICLFSATRLSFSTYCWLRFMALNSDITPCSFDHLPQVLITQFQLLGNNFFYYILKSRFLFKSKRKKTRPKHISMTYGNLYLTSHFYGDNDQSLVFQCLLKFFKLGTNQASNQGRLLLWRWEQSQLTNVLN